MEHIRTVWVACPQPACAQLRGRTCSACSTGGQAHQAHWCPSPKRLQTLFSQVGRYRYLYIGWELAKCTVRTYPASGGAVLGAPEQTGEEAIVGYHTPISITGRVHSAACIQRRGLDAPGPYGHAKRTANRQQKDRRAYVGEVVLCSRIVRHPPYKKAAGGKEILSLVTNRTVPSRSVHFHSAYVGEVVV